MPDLTFTKIDEPAPGKSPAEDHGVTFTPASSTPGTEPHTTAAGVAGSFTRGLAPIAAGAGIGAAIGAPFGGIGAGPGAIAGGAAAAATEFGGDIYNFAAKHLGLPHLTTPSEVTDKALDVVGIRRPSTPTEHSAEMVGGMLMPGMASVKGTEELSDMVLRNQEGAAGRMIDKMYRRVVKPSTTGRETAPMRRTAIDEIIGTKPTLKYAGEDGAVISSGHLPETVEQFGQAIDQAKSKLFTQWDALEREAGARGARVPTDNLVKELRERANDPGLLRDDPAAAKYAGDLADRYAEAGPLLPSEAQESVARWNQKLKAFYKAPSHESPAGEVVARNLRQSLDQTIESAVSPGYQELRNRYRAMVSIERDVDRAARRIANHELGGGILGRGIDITAIAEGATGLASGHGVAGLGAAALTKGVGEYMRWRRAPNRVIKEMFRAAEKYHKAPATYDPMASRAMGLSLPTDIIGSGGPLP